MSFVICPIFWWWIGTELFFTSSSRKLNVSYMFFEDIFYVIDLTCYVKVWLHHIHISIQWLNCDLKHAFITVLRLVTPSYGTSVECIYFSWCNKLFEILHRVKIILHQFLYEGFFMHNLPSFIVLGLLLLRRRWHLSVFVFFWIFRKQFMTLLPIFSRTFVTYLHNQWGICSLL